MKPTPEEVLHTREVLERLRDKIHAALEYSTQDPDTRDALRWCSDAIDDELEKL